MTTDKQSFFRDVRQLVEEYVQERITLLKLQSAEKAARMSAVIFTGVVLAILLFFVLLFLSLMASYFLFKQTNNGYLGLGIVAGFYLLLAIIVMALKKTRIYPWITDAVVRMLFESPDPDNNKNA